MVLDGKANEATLLHIHVLQSVSERNSLFSPSLVCMVYSHRKNLRCLLNKEYRQAREITQWLKHLPQM